MVFTVPAGTDSSSRRSARSAPGGTVGAMFDQLSDRFDGVMRRLRSKGRLSEADVDATLRDIRSALLEADVNIGVVRDICARIREAAIGAARSEALNPGQQVVKAVHTELVAALGGDTFTIGYADGRPTVVVLAGLQGAGKTTTAAKLARWFQTQGRLPLLVAADLQRPAAVEQLRTLAAAAGIGVHTGGTTPAEVAAAGVEAATAAGCDVVIVDTAGRVSVDAALMSELRDVAGAAGADVTMLVIDSMTGQDAVTTAATFAGEVGVDAVILTKLDGDARGGAALSVRSVTGCPIAFAATGETPAAFEVFHPDRMADRILGMGDVLTLIEQAEAAFEAGQAEQAMARIEAGTFTLDDFADQLRTIRRMGPLSGLVKLMPGIPKEVRQAQLSDDDIRPIEAIISSMTPTERARPAIVNRARAARIAAGSGTDPAQVTALVRQFSEMRKMMDQLGVVGGIPGGGRRRRR